MRNVLFALMFLVSFAFAQGVGDASRKPMLEERRAEREEHLREIGGYLDFIPESPSMLIVDARKAPDAAVPGRVRSVINGMFKIAATNMVVALGEKECSGTRGSELRKAGRHLLAIVISNCGSDKPALVVFPEERVAVVNEDAAVKFAHGEEANIRLVKECWRGIGFITGAGYSQTDAGVMQPVGSPLELDTVEWQVIHPLALQQMNKFFKKYGAKRGHRTTYLRACEEGWAPAPTNDYQRAIWDAARAAATNAPAEKVSAPAK